MSRLARLVLCILVLVLALHNPRLVSASSGDGRPPTGLQDTNQRRQIGRIYKRQGTVTAPPPTTTAAAPPVSSTPPVVISTPPVIISTPIVISTPVVQPNPSASSSSNPITDPPQTISDPSPTPDPFASDSLSLSDSLISDSLSLSDTLTNGNGTQSLSQGVLPTPSETANGTATVTDGPSESVSFSMDYNVTTITDESGTHEETLGTYSTPVATYTEPSDTPAPEAQPLVVQQASPEVSNQYVHQAYEPVDAWATTNDQSTTTYLGGADQGTHVAPVSSCRNGTKISNKIGSTIKLSFTGVEASLMIVKSQLGGAYSVQLDDEEPVTMSSYKPDESNCEVSTQWTRTDLINKPHNITLIIKGEDPNVQGSTAGSQLEYSGFIYKGPIPKKNKSPSIGLIVGVSIAAALIIGTLAILACFCVRKRKAQQAEQANAATTATTATTPAPSMQQQGVHRPVSVATTGTNTVLPPSVNVANGNMRQRNGYHTRNDSNFSSTPFIIPSSQTPGQGGGGGGGQGQWPTNGNGNGNGGSPAPMTHSRQTSTADQMSMHSRGGLSWYEGAQPLGVNYNGNNYNVNGNGNGNGYNGNYGGNGNGNGNNGHGANTNSYFGNASVMYPSQSQMGTPQQGQQGLPYVPPPPQHPTHVSRPSYDNQDPFRG